MIVRRARFGEDPSAIAPAEDTIDVRLKSSTALTGLGLWITAGVVTHLAIRFIDGWLDRPRRK